MISIDVVRSVLEEFGAELGLPDLEPDADGEAVLSVGPLDVSFVYESDPMDALYLYCEIGEFDPAGPAPAFLLNVNYVAWVAGYMTIAKAEGRPVATAHSIIPISALNPEILRQTFTGFVETALELEKALAAEDFSGLDALIDRDGTSQAEPTELRV